MGREPLKRGITLAWSNVIAQTAVVKRYELVNDWLDSIIFGSEYLRQSQSSISIIIKLEFVFGVGCSYVFFSIFVFAVRASMHDEAVRAPPQKQT